MTLAVAFFKEGLRRTSFWNTQLTMSSRRTKQVQSELQVGLASRGSSLSSQNGNAFEQTNGRPMDENKDDKALNDKTLKVERSLHQISSAFDPINSKRSDTPL